MDDKLKKAADDFVFTIRLALREVDRLEAEGQGVRADALLKALSALTGETLSDLDKILSETLGESTSVR